MRRTHLAVQAAVVLTMVSLVSWPEFRPVRGQSVWRYAPAAVLQARTSDATRFAGDKATGRATVAAEQTPSTFADEKSAPGYYVAPEVLAAGGKVNALLGVARTSLNAPIPHARVVLRDIRTGQVLGQTTADEEGNFTFLDIEANAYIIELLGADGAVVATSTMMTIGRGELRRTEVRVAAGAAAVKASLGGTLTPWAPQAVDVASRNNVTRTTPSQVPAVSPGPRP